MKAKEDNRRKPLKIIHSSTPSRINDIGGWTDTWFSKEGKVLNMAVSPLVEVRIKVFESEKKKEERVFVRAQNYDESFLVNPEKPKYDKHPLLQGAINSLPIPKEFELYISLRSHVPAGSATGTSASVCVALLGALDSLTPQKNSLDEIVSLAHRVETEKLGLQSGIQDQISAAYGGICFIHMYSYPQAYINKLALDERNKKELNQRLCLVYLGKSHSSSALHEEVITFLEKRGSQFRMIQRLKNLAEQARDYLLVGDLNSFGDVMIQNNETQRSLHKGLISEEADSVILIAKKYKAAGWKVNGAGGKGGSLTILGNQEQHLRIEMLQDIDALSQGIRTIPVSLAPSGLQIWEET
ncbi:MAG: GHMP kinase [Candidatus Aminicenantes bacterium]|nr:MAG: GHMP kinase [Candidatus Aminicenantes bacterium]